VVTSPPDALAVFALASAEPRECTEKEGSLRFDEIYAELGPRVHRFLTDLLRDRTLAADATQETFVRAFRSTRPAGVRVAAWIFGIARNVSLELRRTRARRFAYAEVRFLRLERTR
jgi:DNA-directed RNA polymerase specialized sigma24 family protein